MSKRYRGNKLAMAMGGTSAGASFKTADSTISIVGLFVNLPAYTRHVCDIMMLQRQS